jgi:hypothetical protein
MERAPVVLGRAVLVSASSCQLRPNGCSQDAHLLGGRGFFRSLLVLLRATGSKPWTRSSDGGGTAKEVDCATSCSGSNEAWRHNEGRFACIKGRASLSRADAARDGRSRRAIATDDVEMARCRDMGRPTLFSETFSKFLASAKCCRHGSIDGIEQGSWRSGGLDPRLVEPHHRSNISSLSQCMHVRLDAGRR